MTYVVTKSCLGCKDASCVEVCPVDCFYDIQKQEYNRRFDVPYEGDDGKPDGVHPNAGLLVIHPDECIDCGACVVECPVGAIYEARQVPEKMREFIQINAKETVGKSEAELDKLRCIEKRG